MFFVRWPAGTEVDGEHHLCQLRESREDGHCDTRRPCRLVVRPDYDDGHNWADDNIRSRRAALWGRAPTQSESCARVRARTCSRGDWSCTTTVVWLRVRTIAAAKVHAPFPAVASPDRMRTGCLVCEKDVSSTCPCVLPYVLSYVLPYASPTYTSLRTLGWGGAACHAVPSAAAFLAAAAAALAAIVAARFSWTDGSTRAIT